MLSNPAPTAEQSNTRVQSKENVYIRVYKLSFEEPIKWSIVLEGTKHPTVEVADPEFLIAINNNARFAKGDAFLVNIDFHQSLDLQYNAYINKRLVITKIVEHIVPDSAQAEIWE